MNEVLRLRKASSRNPRTDSSPTGSVCHSPTNSDGGNYSKKRGRESNRVRGGGDEGDGGDTNYPAKFRMSDLGEKRGTRRGKEVFDGKVTGVLSRNIL